MNLSQRSQHAVTTKVYQSELIQESMFSSWINGESRGATNESYANEQLESDDILLRMERLRILALSRRREEYNSRRQQFSFCF